MVEIFKIISPIILFSYWINHSRTQSNNLNILMSLLVVSFVSFSSNFFSIYRELYQITQMLLIFCFIYLVLRGSRISQVILYMLSFALLVFFSFFGNEIDSDSLVQTVNFISIFGVIGFTSFVFKYEENIYIFVDFLGRIAFLVAILGIIEFLVIKSPRIELTFANPNYYAFFLGLGFCAVFISSKQFLFKTKLFVILIAIILSGSRAGLAFPILQFIWYLYIEKKYLRIGVIMFLLSIAYFNLNIDRGGNTDGSDAERLLFSKIAIQMAKDNPYNGVGWGRFPAEFSNYNNIKPVSINDVDIDASSQDRRVTHNDLLRILSELGVLAFFMSVFFILYILFILLKRKGFSEAFLLPSWAGLILFSLTHNNMNSVFFWIYLFLPLFYKNIKDRNYLS